MTYMDKSVVVEDRDCPDCGETHEVEITTEYEGRYVSVSWRCPNCSYEGRSDSFDDDPDLGAHDHDFYQER